MTPLRIQHATGIRFVNVYRVPTRERNYARSTLHAAYALGDGTENPNTFTVEMELVADGFSSAVFLAYEIMEEAQTATFVEYHRGLVEVDRLQSHELRGDALAVVLRLTWRVTQRGVQLFGWDRTDVTFDDTSVTMDQETIQP